MTTPKALPVLLLAACLLAGCREADDRVRIRIWHEKRSAERTFFEQVVAEYMAAHPGVVVETLYREPEDLRNLFVVAAVGGSGPDVIYSPADNAGVFDLTDVVLPLDTLFEPGFFDAFSPEGLVRVGGEVVMLSDQIRTFLAFVYNRALIDTPPETMDAFVDVLRAATKDLDGDGRPDQYGLTWNYREPYFFIPFLTCFGGWVMDAEGRPTLDTEATVRAIRFILDLRDRYGVIPGESDYEVAEALFTEGRAASVINGPWAYAGYGNAGVDYGIAPLPRNEALGQWCAPMVATSGFAVSRNVAPEKLPYIRDLLVYLTSDAMQERLVERLHLIPSRRAVRASEAVRRDTLLQAMIRQVELGRPMPLEPQMRQIWDGMRGPYQLVMNGAVSPEAGARLMQQEVEKRIEDTYL